MRKIVIPKGIQVLLIPIWVFMAQPLQAADVFKGKEVYQRYCLGCHGASGSGMMPNMPNFSRGDRLHRTDRELMDVIRDGNGVMPSFYGILDEDKKEFEDVVAYLRTFL